MENASKLIEIGFGAIIFVAALTACMIMYNNVLESKYELDDHISPRGVLEGEWLE